jgi:recombination protein RecA
MSRETIIVAAKNSRRPQNVIQSVAGLLTGRLAHYVLPAKADHRSPEEVTTLTSGFRPLDKAVGVGGLPRGYLTELIAPSAASDSSGTLCIAATIAAKAQRRQQVVTIIDLSHRFDPWLAERSGLVAPQLLLSRPDTIFKAITTLEEAARQEGLVVVSLGLVSELLAHVEPNLLKLFLRRLRAIMRQSESAFLFITSPLEDDPFNPAGYLPNFQLDELADIRLWVQDENWTYKHSVATAYRASVTVIKNQLAPVGTGADIRIKFSGF